jgi:glycosyltransferase involved in cell wall biosynthesis
MILYNIKKVKDVIKREGLIDGSKFILAKLKSKKNIMDVIKKRNLFKFYSYVLLEEKKAKLAYSGNNQLRLAWFIPDFGIGSGGHLNIFRVIHMLEKKNIFSDIYICGESQWGTPIKIKEIIDKYFFKLTSKVYVISGDAPQYTNEYDIVLATSWQTAYVVRAYEHCVKKAYFVQDFEPYFYAHGSAYSFSENTYNFGFYGITAGDWLKKKLSNEYNMQCNSFSFSFDHDLYTISQKREPEAKRLFFYARPPTDRRGFELGMLALNDFCSKNPDTEVVMAGWDVSEYEIPFKHFNAGVVKIEELTRLYSQCNVALILSYTNLSLLPLELLASGCPVVINEGFNNSWIDPDNELFIYVKPTVDSISKTLDAVINEKIDTSTIMQKAQDYLKTNSWDTEVTKISSYLKLCLEEK